MQNFRFFSFFGGFAAKKGEKAYFRGLKAPKPPVEPRLKRKDLAGFILQIPS